MSSAGGLFSWHRSLLIGQGLTVWEGEKVSWFDGGWWPGPQKNLDFTALSPEEASEE